MTQLPDHGEALVLTNLRVMAAGLRDGQWVTTLAPLAHVSAVEVREVQRRPGRLTTGSLVTAIGLLVAIFLWVQLGLPLLALIFGGIMAVVGIYLLLAYFLNEEEGACTFAAGGKELALPLRTRRATADAHLLVERFWELLAIADARPADAPATDVTQKAPETTVAEKGPEEKPPVVALPEGTAERQFLLEKLESTRQGLISLLQGLDEGISGRSPREGEWSVKQNLAHLAEVEVRFAGDALRARQGEADVGPEGVEQWTRSQDGADAKPLEALLQELVAARADTLAAIGAITNEELFRKLQHRRFGELNILQLLRAIYRHERMHTEQISSALASLAKAQPTTP